MPHRRPRRAAAQLPKARMIDPRGHRFGAGVSAILLVVAFLTGTVWLVALALLSIGVSAAFGLKYSIYGVIWRRIAKVPALPKVEPEHEYPPRFAQTLGSIALILALVAFALGATTLGWVFTLAVAGLQTVLAVTGYCLGCRLYFLRWWVPSIVTRIWTRGRVRRPATGRLPRNRSSTAEPRLIGQDVGPGVRPGRDDLVLGLVGPRRSNGSGTDGGRPSPRPRPSR